MDKIFTIKIVFTILGIAIFSGVFLFGNAARADNPPLEVEFQNEPNPLFNEANFLSNQNVTGWIKVKNNSGKDQKIVIEAVNYSDPALSTDLSRALIIVIKEDAKERYRRALSDFYLDSGEPSPKDDKEIYLSDLENGGIVEYDIIISFPVEKGNEWKNKTTSFDLAIGFQGVKDERIAIGTILGAATELPEETILQKIGKVLGAATETGASILFIFLLSLTIAFLLHFNSQKTQKNSGKI